MYWVSVDNPAVKMASLNGTGQVTLLAEPKASYTGITLYKDSLYISDDTRRSIFSVASVRKGMRERGEKKGEATGEKGLVRKERERQGKEKESEVADRERKYSFQVGKRVVYMYRPNVPVDI